MNHNLVLITDPQELKLEHAYYFVWFPQVLAASALRGLVWWLRLLKMEPQVPGSNLAASKLLRVVNSLRGPLPAGHT